MTGIATSAPATLSTAAVTGAPVVFLCNNNQWAISTPLSAQTRAASLADKAVGYGIPGVIVDGADVLACYRAAKEAVDRARRGDGPTLIEAKVIRLTAHSSDDQQTKYRSAEELSDLAAKDPLPRFRKQLHEAGVLSDELEAKIAAELKAEVDEATDYSEAAAEPDPETAMKWVYAEDWPGETPPTWGFTLRGSSGH